MPAAAAQSFQNSLQGSHSFRNTDSMASGNVEWMSQYVENGYRAEGEAPQQQQQQQHQSRFVGDMAAIDARSKYSHNGYRPDAEAPHQRQTGGGGDASSSPTPPGGISVIPQSYVMHQELGSGGAGKAFLVHGKLDGKRYVAKQIVCLGEKYKAASASYALHETRLLFLLQHPHIVELRDFYPKSANYFIVMEFCENGDLAGHIENASRRGSKFDSERIFTWWYQMLDGVDFCHSKGVIHRDLKPKNIFLDGNMHIKIGDFGVAALTSFPPAMERVGTVTYHAPEVTAALMYSTKSDVWSIGCIMWETMTIRPPGKHLFTHIANLDLKCA